MMITYMSIAISFFQGFIWFLLRELLWLILWYFLFYWNSLMVLHDLFIALCFMVKIITSLLETLILLGLSSFPYWLDYPSILWTSSSFNCIILTFVLFIIFVLNKVTLIHIVAILFNIVLHLPTNLLLLGCRYFSHSCGPSSRCYFSLQLHIALAKSQMTIGRPLFII